MSNLDRSRRKVYGAVIARIPDIKLRSKRCVRPQRFPANWPAAVPIDMPRQRAAACLGER